MNWMRRKFFQASSLLGAGFLLSGNASAQHEHREAPKPDEKNGKAATPQHDHQKMMAEQAKQSAGGNTPVITPDLPKLEYKMDDGVKVFNLTAEVVECELMPKSHMGPARKMNAWVYNGSVPGPMIEVNEG